MIDFSAPVTKENRYRAVIHTKTANYEIGIKRKLLSVKILKLFEKGCKFEELNFSDLNNKE